MAEDELAKKIAEARKKMFGSVQPSGGKTKVIVTGEAKVTSTDPKVVIEQQPLPRKGD